MNVAGLSETNLAKIGEKGVGVVDVEMTDSKSKTHGKSTETEVDGDEDDDEDASSASGSASGDEPGALALDLPEYHDWVHELLVSCKSGECMRILPASIKYGRKGPIKMQDVVKLNKNFAEGDEVLSATYSVTTEPVLSKSAQKKKELDDRKKRDLARKDTVAGAGPGGLPPIKEEDEGPVPMEE